MFEGADLDVLVEINEGRKAVRFGDLTRNRALLARREAFLHWGLAQRLGGNP